MTTEKPIDWGNAKEVHEGLVAYGLKAFDMHVPIMRPAFERELRNQMAHAAMAIAIAVELGPDRTRDHNGGFEHEMKCAECNGSDDPAIAELRNLVEALGKDDRPRLEAINRAKAFLGLR